jgi:hypothetical protein
MSELNAYAAAIVTITNTYNGSAVKLPSDLLKGSDDLWNRGAAAVNGADATIPDTTSYPAIMQIRHIAAVRLFGGNSYAYIVPGDRLVLHTSSSKETLYYQQFASELVSVSVVEAGASV